MTNKSSINTFSSISNSISNSSKSTQIKSASSFNSKNNNTLINSQSNSNNFNDSNSQSISTFSNSSKLVSASTISNDSLSVSSNQNNKYLQYISHNANTTNSYFDKINSISNNINKHSEDISSISNKLNILNSLIGLNRLTISDNESINQIAQAVAVNIIKVNNQKIKALTAKNNISNASFKVNFDYNNYLRAKKVIKNDVTGINTHMGSSGATFNQGMNILNSHNSLITSYANQLSFDASNADKNVVNAKNAASNAANYQASTSSAYNKVHLLANHLSQKVINAAKSNANNTKSIASNAINLNSKANYYNRQIASISHKYSHDSSIASANQTITNNLQSVDSNNQYINGMASHIITATNQMKVGINVKKLGHNYQSASQAVNVTSARKDIITSNLNNISSAMDIAKSASSSLHDKQEALTNGAKDYMPVLNMKSLNTDNHTLSYIKYYKKGYQDARKGFNKRIYQLLSNSQLNAWDPNASSRVGFNNAQHFIKGINDARQQVIKNGEYINSKHYNYGYDTCHKLIHNHSLPKTTNHKFITVNQAVLLVIGYLIGSYDSEN